MKMIYIEELTYYQIGVRVGERQRCIQVQKPELPLIGAVIHLYSVVTRSLMDDERQTGLPPLPLVYTYYTHVCC